MPVFRHAGRQWEHQMEAALLNIQPVLIVFKQLPYSDPGLPSDCTQGPLDNFGQELEDVVIMRMGIWASAHLCSARLEL